MIKVSVVNNVTGQSYGSTFETQEQADAWIALCRSKNTWGLGERWVTDTPLTPVSQEDKDAALETREIEIRPEVTATEYKILIDEEEVWVESSQLTQEEIDTALESREVVVTPKESWMEYKLPAHYEITEEDVTAQHQLQLLIQKGLRAQEAGNLIIAKVYALNNQKNLTNEQYTAILSDQTLQNIERLLKNGSLETAKNLILASDLSAFFTQNEIDAIVADLNEALS